MSTYLGHSILDDEVGVGDGQDDLLGPDVSSVNQILHLSDALVRGDVSHLSLHWHRSQVLKSCACSANMAESDNRYSTGTLYWEARSREAAHNRNSRACLLV